MNPDDNFIFPPGLPDEIKEQIKSMVDRQRMAQTVTRQSVARFFQELTQDQLDTFAFLMNAAGGNPQAAAFYEGFARAMLGAKHGKWPGWDDEPALDVTVNFDADGEIEIEGVAQPRTDETPNIERMMASVREQDAPPTRMDREADLKDYNLSLSNEVPKVVCNGCGMTYQSIEDRMIVRECHGCIDKAKWG